MRNAKALLCLSACVVVAASPDTPQRGVEPSDIDGGVDPCVDFFAYANGSWRANNPIPASMPRWSRRWAAGEATKGRLREILDQTSAVSGRAKGSVEQLMGDFYGACMGEAQANRLGVKPLSPLLSEIDGIQNAAAVQRVIARFHAIAIPVPFALAGESDNHTPTDVIAKLYASGLGMPDRDYYVKPEPRFVEAREKYVAHVAATFQLAGPDSAPANSPAATVLPTKTP